VVADDSGCALIAGMLWLDVHCPAAKRAAQSISRYPRFKERHSNRLASS
jgi:hypothetical protein